MDEVARRREVSRLSARDRSLLLELLRGVERWRGQLDYWIEQLAERPKEGLDSAVLWTLRIALYQIEHLRVPPHAAVNEAVDACRGLGAARAAGFVNALLRRFLREKPRLPAGYSPRAMAARWSHPEWLVRRYASRYGNRQTDRLLRRNNRRPRGHLWLNPRRTDPQSFQALLKTGEIEHEQLPDGTFVVDDRSFVNHEIYRNGLCFYMDWASQRIASLADLSGRRRLGDFCAAPGGKSMVLASRMDAAAELHCTDASECRLRTMRRRALELGFAELSFSCVDWERAGVFGPVFDFILLDVPCSGLGTLRSNPDLRWRVREGDLKNYQRRQSFMLQHAFDSLRRGGLLVYSTCSTEPEENQEVVESLLQARPDAYRTAPDFTSFSEECDADGFYAALIGQR